MKVDYLKLINFRNYDYIDLSFDKGVHVLVGDNAQGKTNILEALFLAVLGKSFRAGQDEEMIRWECDSSKIDIAFSNQISENLLQITLSKSGVRENTYNGQLRKKRDIIGNLNAVLFCPEDLWLIKGSPAIRRRFLDFTLSQIDKRYYHILLKYNRVILQRNHLLKKVNYEKGKDEILDIWDDQLIDLATELFCSRINLVEELSVIAKEKYTKIAGGAEIFSAHYFIFCKQKNEEVQKVNYREWYARNLRVLRNKDIQKGTTEIGPHKDDVCFFVDSYDAKYFASQGQQRTAIVSLKLAEIEIMKNKLAEYPILLLDDVMSELDQYRRKKIIDEINGKIQTFITGTDKIDGIAKLKATYYSVAAGSIFRI